MVEFDYELRDDGVLYRLRDEIAARVRGNSSRRATVTLQKGDVVVPPETGNLGGSALRERLVARARERFGEVNGLVEDLGLIAAAFDDHLRERLEAAEEHVRENETPEFADTLYRISEEGGFVRVKVTGEGEVYIPLTNFIGRVEEELVRDDGAEKTRMYRVSGSIGERPLPRAIVPASQFANLNWIGENWGLEAHVYAGQHAYAREAIELFSMNATKSFRYAHTGWRVLEDGTRVYLHAGGAL